jgi:peptidylprolyl isomerase
MSTQPRSTAESKRRGQAIAGALSGLVVVIVLFAVFFGVKAANNDKPAKTVAQPAPAAAASQPAEDPSAAAQADPQAQASQPAAANVKIPAALSKAPTIKAGGAGKVTKIKITPIVQGTGAVVKKGQTLTANYVVATYKDGKVVDSSWKTGQPFSAPIGVGQVIPGWDNSIPGQRIGSRLQIDVPEADAYPGQGDLRFIVDLLAAK